jgi:signal transduction histidine kinase
MLKTIVRNLLSNALKFTRREGVITISDEIVDHEIKISFNDTGIGIEPQIMEKLFTGEVGVSSANTSGEAGTGLGLVLCKDFIDIHKGKIWVESELGKGSTFFISLPKKIQ